MRLHSSFVLCLGLSLALPAAQAVDLNTLKSVTGAVSGATASKPGSSASGLSNSDMTGGLKDALAVGAERAIKGLGKAGGFLKEWSDAVLFAQHETFAVKDGQRSKGVSTGARVVHTEREAAFDAKNRYGLPATIPLGWSEFVDAIAAVDSAKHAEALRAEIATVTAKLEDAELTPKVEKAVADAGDNTNTLNEILNRVQARAAKKESV